MMTRAKERLLLAVLLAIPLAVFGQTAAPVTPPTTPNICDVTYSADTETSDQNDVGSSFTSGKAVPWADVVDNHNKQLRVISAVAQQQNKGGSYTVTVTET